jgi:hypothetical protein
MKPDLLYLLFRGEPFAEEDYEDAEAKDVSADLEIR